MTSEIFHVNNGLSLETMEDIFCFSRQGNLNLRSASHLALRNILTTQLRDISNSGAQTWDLLQRDRKKIVLPHPFSKIKLEDESLKNIPASFVWHI